MYILSLLYLIPLMCALTLDAPNTVKNFVEIYPRVTLPVSYIIDMFFSVIRLSMFIMLSHLDKHNLKKSATKRLLYDRVLKKFSVLKCLSTTITTIIVTTTFWVSCLNLLLLTICNMSITNPGPDTSCCKVFYLNIQGLVTQNTLSNSHPTFNLTKLLEFQSYTYKHKPDIVILNETWLKPSIKDNEILDSSIYTIFRKDRSINSHPPDSNDPNKFKVNGGGVLIAVRNELNFKPKIIDSKCHAEMMSVELTMPSKNKICISTCYRVGTLGTSNHSEIQQHLNFISSNRKIKSHFFVGDLNLDRVKWDNLTSTSSIQNLFLSTFNDLGWTQLISRSTHTRGNILDVLLTNNPHLISSVYIHNSEVIKSDHYAISCNVNIKPKRIKINKRKLYNFKKANWQGLNNELRHIDWNSLLGYCDITTAWLRFKTTLFNICDKHIPKISISSKGNAPWFDSEVYKMCNKKDRLRKLYKQTNNNTYYEKYKNCRKSVKKLIKSKMRSNFDDDLNPNCITKKFWSYVKSSSKSSRLPETIHMNGKFRTEPVDKGNLFNEHFYLQFSQTSNYNLDIDFRNDPFADFKIDHRQLRKILATINPHKSMGPDNISGFVIKNCAVSIAYPLSLLFNLSFNTGQLPEEWKLANIVPVFKKGDRSCVENYRPISLTCIVSKIFEKCLRDSILDHCKNKLHDNQHGFLPNKSCNTQMLPFIHNISLGLNANKDIDIVYFDFAKAFDSVNHDIILEKLRNEFNVNGLMLKFLKEYLKDRSQRVLVNGHYSSILSVKSGVPQGSILGPLLFVLFINDINICVSSGTNIALYADDTKIWRIIDSENDSIILQNDIVSLKNWSIRNRMTFHPQKCKVLTISRKYSNIYEHLPFYRFPYMMGNTLLDNAELECDLGININRKLNWNSHHDIILSKATNVFNLVRRTCHFVNSTSKKRTLYLTLVRSLFEHGSNVWHPQNSSSINKFENFQKRCIKWIFNEQYMSYTAELLLSKLKELDILPLKEKFIYNDIVTFHKIIHRLIPLSLPSTIVIGHSRTRSGTNNSDYLTYTVNDTTTINKQVLSQDFFIRCLNTWNSLPLSTREISTVSMFGTTLKTWLWDKLTQFTGNDFPEYDNQMEPD